MLKFGTGRRVRQLVLVAGVALLGSGLVLAPPALAGPKKFYSASITPTTAAGNATVSFTLTITNSTSSQQNLGSANITIPSGLTSPVLGAVTPPPGKTWTAALVGSVIQLRNPGPNSSNALSAGQSVSVVVTVTTSCPGGTLVWLTAAKQSNDFSGTGNDFLLSGADLSWLVGLMVAGGAYLAGMRGRAAVPRSVPAVAGPEATG